MTERPYLWKEGATLSEHSHRKHKIVREYFADYLRIRCQLPHQTKFRLAVVDGFAGGGRYDCGSPGSPLIFLEELEGAADALNVNRAVNGMAPLDIECFLLFNDFDRDAIELLKTRVAPLEAKIKTTAPHLHLRVDYMNKNFEVAYPEIKKLLILGQYSNVLFNLDQCGHSHVEKNSLLDILQSFRSAEVFYTFMINSLIAFLHKSNPRRLQSQLAPIGISEEQVRDLQGAILSRREWLGTAERIVFDNFRNCASYVSPFSINNPDGWRYWLIHFSNSYRARQVYNNTLHSNSSMQAHFGRSGLDMLVYDPSHDGPHLYLFDDSGRERSRRQLHDDVPRLVSESGDAISVEDFYGAIYNATPAHSEDVHAVIIENPDLEVITPAGGERRKSNTIAVGDTIKLKRQLTFFPMFLNKSPLQNS